MSDIYEIIDQWKDDHPYRDIYEDKPYSNEVRYIKDHELGNIKSAINFLNGVKETEIKLLLSNINLYYYSRRSHGNYSKAKERPDKKIDKYLKKIDTLISFLDYSYKNRPKERIPSHLNRIDDLIEFLDKSYFKDDLENLKILETKLKDEQILTLLKDKQALTLLKKHIVKLTKLKEKLKDEQALTLHSVIYTQQPIDKNKSSIELILNTIIKHNNISVSKNNIKYLMTTIGEPTT